MCVHVAAVSVDRSISYSGLISPCWMPSQSTTDGLLAVTQSALAVPLTKVPPDAGGTGCDKRQCEPCECRYAACLLAFRDGWSAFVCYILATGPITLAAFQPINALSRHVNTALMLKRTNGRIAKSKVSSCNFWRR